MTVKELLIGLGLSIENSGGRLDMNVEILFDHYDGFNFIILEAVPFYPDLGTADVRGRYIENGIAFDFDANRVVIRAREV